MERGEVHRRLGVCRFNHCGSVTTDLQARPEMTSMSGTAVNSIWVLASETPQKGASKATIHHVVNTVRCRWHKLVQGRQGNASRGQESDLLAFSITEELS